MKKWIFVGLVLVVFVILMAVTKTLIIGAGIVMLVIFIAIVAMIAGAETLVGGLGSSLVQSVGIKKVVLFMIVGIPLAMIFGYLILLLTRTFLNPNGFLYPASIFSAIFFYIGYLGGFNDNYYVKSTND